MRRWVWLALAFLCVAACGNRTPAWPGAEGCCVARRVAIDAAFSPAEAERVRAAIAQWRRDTRGAACLVEVKPEEAFDVAIERYGSRLPMRHVDPEWDRHIGVWERGSGTMAVVVEKGCDASCVGAIAAHEIGHQFRIGHQKDARVPSLMHESSPSALPSAIPEADVRAFFDENRKCAR